MHKKYYLLLMVITGLAVFGQTDTAKDSLKTDGKRWEAKVDLKSRYIWRGQAYGGNTPAIQPSFSYCVTENLSIGMWATHNFRCEDGHADGSSDGYREFNFGLDYQLADFLSLGIWQYYWPSLDDDPDADTRFFHYGPASVTTIDAGLTFDFSENYRYAFQAAINTFISGNDFRYGDKGESTRNFTTYAEIGYVFKDVFNSISAKTFRGISLTPVTGAVLNNRAGYYEAADYNKVSFINLSVAAEREFDLGYGIAMPVCINYTHNGGTANTALEGRDFLTATLSFKY
ncbi:TorF family putative porin [Flavobacterium pallidum]|uniref:Uncharacterized protein n=1 Tax=Flavobacterium pallidum TaxID=2172098 RepID=A0A2S1SHQ0_9FLAO|nr:TorF family putative porin [Flavobacterium pallidum]AWI25938.1 hypothetical protein HYN49_08510 [Flavobacterium pallidum]